MEVALGAVAVILGSVIGSVVLEWLAGRRDERHQAEGRSRHLHGLRTEMAENSALDSGGDWRKAPFSTDAWETAKFVLSDLEPEIGDLIRQAYVRVRAHNALIEYDRATMESGRGTLDAEIRKSATHVMEAMQAALHDLDADEQVRGDRWRLSGRPWRKLPKN